MNKHIAILRGINVGGHRKILMVDLKKLFEELNFSDITTYIQSGNVIFSSNKKLKPINLEIEIEKAIKKKFDYDVPVIIRTVKEIQAMINDNPYKKNIDEDINKLYVTFLKSTPEKEYLNKFNELSFSPDNFVIINNHVYLRYDQKSSDSKLSNNLIENKLKVIATSRNWKTVLKLQELSS